MLLENWVSFPNVELPRVIPTVTVGLSANGQEPATHFWCCTHLRPATWQAVQGLQASFTGSTFVELAEGGAFENADEVLANLGLQRITSSLL